MASWGTFEVEGFCNLARRISRYSRRIRGSENEISSTPFVEDDLNFSDLQKLLDFVTMAANGGRLKWRALRWCIVWGGGVVGGRGRGEGAGRGQVGGRIDGILRFAHEVGHSLHLRLRGDCGRSWEMMRGREVVVVWWRWGVVVGGR